MPATAGSEKLNLPPGYRHGAPNPKGSIEKIDQNGTCTSSLSLSLVNILICWISHTEMQYPETGWHLRTELGPFSLSDLRDHYLNGHISEDTPLRCDGVIGRWTLASNHTLKEQMLRPTKDIDDYVVLHTNSLVYVTDLPDDVTVDQVVQVFSKMGKIPRDPTTSKPRVEICDLKEARGKKKGAAVWYLKEADASFAVKTLNNALFRSGHIISVTKAIVSAPAPANKEVGGFDEFDPRGSFSGMPVTSNGAEMDLLGSLSDSFSNPLAIMPVTSGTAATDDNASANFSSGPTFGATPSASSVTNQPFEDPFGDGPFKAVPTSDGSPSQLQNSAPTSSFHPMANQRSELTQPIPEVVDNTVNNGDAFPGMTYTPPTNSNAQFSSTNAHFLPNEFPTSNQNTDILADILPLSSQTGFPGQGSQPPLHAGFLAQTSYPTPLTGFSAQTGQPGHVTGYPGLNGSASQTGFPAPSTTVQPNANFYGNFLQQQPAAPHTASQNSAGPTTQYNPANFLSQAQPTPTMTSQPHLTSSSGQLATVPQQSKDKFDPKSEVWADALSRGLVNLDILGPKTNLLADIGVDFVAINRREKRFEKPTTMPVTSTINMGKAMGSGSGMGRAAASSLRPPANLMVGSGMGMGAGMGGPGAGMGMGGYAGNGMNQPMGMGGYAGNGMNQPMGMGMAQGSQMQPTGFPPRSTMPGGYNPMMGRGGAYASQQLDQAAATTTAFLFGIGKR